MQWLILCIDKTVIPEVVLCSAQAFYYYYYFSCHFIPFSVCLLFFFIFFYKNRFICFEWFCFVLQLLKNNKIQLCVCALWPIFFFFYYFHRSSLNKYESSLFLFVYNIRFSCFLFQVSAYMHTDSTLPFNPYEFSVQTVFIKVTASR